MIDRPLEACFAYLTDLTNDLEWRREWIDGGEDDGRSPGVGARYRLTGALLGRRIATERPSRTSRTGWRQLEGDFPKLKQVMDTEASCQRRLPRGWSGEESVMKKVAPAIRIGLSR